MKRLHIFHETRYEFSEPVVLGNHRLLVRPREGHDVRIDSSKLAISPLAGVRWHRDVMDNSVAVASFSTPASVLSFTSEVTLDHFDDRPLDFVVEDEATTYPFTYKQSEFRALEPYLDPYLGRTSGDDTPDPLTRDWLNQFDTRNVETYVLLSQLSNAIGTGLAYTIREEPGVQSADETLQLGSGSCRDFAWLLMQAARMLGLAARFVSGYLHVPDFEDTDGATHAWAEIYLPGAGWKGFDPTTLKLAGTGHIPVAVADRKSVV